MPELDLSTILFTVVNFAIVVVLLRLLLFKPVLKMIDKRRALIESELDAAAAKTESADRLLGEAETNLRQRQEEASRLIDDARRAAEQKKDDLLAETRRQVQALTARVENEIRLERRHNLQKQQEAIVDLSLTLAGRLIEQTLDEDDHRALIDDFLRGLGESEEAT